MGQVRTLVVMDETGAPQTVERCAWAVDAMEIFSDDPNPPFRKHWARHLMERCSVVVGRAWTRTPDDRRLQLLHERLVLQLKEDPLSGL